MVNKMAVDRPMGEIRACPKPMKQSPEQRKAAKQNREPNPLKPTFAKTPKLGEQETRVRARADQADQYRVEGSSLRAISKKKLAQLEAQGRRITSTFRPKPGHRPLQHKRKIGDQTVKKVTTKGWTFKRGQPIKREGVRGRRLRPGDRKQEALSHVLPCVCGCNAHQQPGAGGVPGKGLISRAHLESRAYEYTRNEDTNNLPACLNLNHWLDFEPGGPTAKDELWQLAQQVRRRLLPVEVQAILSQNGYYTWIHERAVRER